MPLREPSIGGVPRNQHRLGTLVGGSLADRFGRRTVLRAGFAGAAVFLTLFVLTLNQSLALMLLVPLALCIFLPSSVQVVLGQEYLPSRVGMASGVTLGLAVSVGGMAAPLLGRLADWQGLSTRVPGIASDRAVGNDSLFRAPFNRGSSRCPPIHLHNPYSESGRDHPEM